MAAEEPQQQKQEPLGSDSEGVNCLAYDEAIMAQQDRIQQEIAVHNPLVSERLELSVLYKEYAEDDNIYQQKIKVGTGRRARTGACRACALGGAVLEVCRLWPRDLEPDAGPAPQQRCPGQVLRPVCGQVCAGRGLPTAEAAPQPASWIC